MIGAAERFLMPRNDSALLQMIEHYVARESYFYVTGTVPSEKVVSLTEKFAARYPTILASSRERTAARKLKAARVNLFWWPRRFVDSWTFLLLSDRRLPDERMLDCRRSNARITISGWSSTYVNTRRAGGAWTWQLTDDTYQYWREQLGTAARDGRGELLQQRIDKLLRVNYMAGGVRSQVFGLLNEVQRVYRSNRQPSGVDLIVPERIVKARRMKWHSSPPVTLAAAVETMRTRVEQEIAALHYSGSQQHNPSLPAPQPMLTGAVTLEPRKINVLGDQPADETVNPHLPE